MVEDFLAMARFILRRCTKFTGATYINCCPSSPDTVDGRNPAWSGMKETWDKWCDKRPTSTGDRRIYSINRIGSAVSPGCSVMCAAGHEMKAQYCGGVLCPKGHALILWLVSDTVEKRGGAKQRSMYFGLSPFSSTVILANEGLATCEDI